MKKLRFWRPLVAAIFVFSAFGAMAPAAWADEAEPLWVFIPTPPIFPSGPTLPPPIGVIDGPCGAAVDSAGHFYVSDYYHDAVDVWDHEGTERPPGSGRYVEYYYEPDKRPPAGEQGYLSQITPVDTNDGPCALAIDGENNVYVNDFHRRVIKYGETPPASPPATSWSSGTVIAGQGVDSTHPTGVAVDPTTGTVYVDDRTYIAVYEADGTPVMDGANPLRIGVGTLQDGYGLAYSTYPGTEGELYVADAATNTVKVYDPSVDKVNTVAKIDASGTPLGHFVSLRDGSVAVDRVSGEVYVVDDLRPLHTEKPEAVIQVFDATGGYEGHLPNRVEDALPVGIAVDNGASPRFTSFTYLPPPSLEESAIRIPNGTQGMVYVTSGNTTNAAIYNYAPGSATTEEEAGPAAFQLKITVTGEGAGQVRSSLSPHPCADICEETVAAGGQVVLTATPSSASAFGGWSGACTGNAPSCTIKLDQASSAEAHFVETEGPATTAGGSTATQPAVAPPAAATPHRRRHVRRHHRRGRHHKRAAKGRGGAG